MKYENYNAKFMYAFYMHQYPLLMLMLIVRFERNMGTLRVTVGGVIKMTMMVLEETKVQTLLPMVLIQIGTLTVELQIISLEN